MDLSRLYKTHVSLTEWLEEVSHPDAEAMRKEDNDKRDRMAQLGEIIDFPFDRPVLFSASDIADNTPEFQTYREKHGNDHYALRLVPLEPALPKLRMRGQTLDEVTTEWFPEQKIDPEKYKAEIVPHPVKPTWATIFVVNEHGIFGEIVYGGHHILTQGLHEDKKPITFSYNYSSWYFSEPNEEAEKEILFITNKLLVPNSEIQKKIINQFETTFVHNYLVGYFEATDSLDFGLMFVDYNRILGKLYKDFQTTAFRSTSEIGLHGQSASPGNATGVARVVSLDQISSTHFRDGDILVCQMTSPEYIPLMQKAGAIVTEQGGILSHAAIVARELGKPCVIGVTNATKIIIDGSRVDVDGSHGALMRHN